MLDQNNTPLPPEGELKFQIQAMTKIMERMNFVMGNVCDRLERVEKHGNEAGTSTQDVRMVRSDSKPNNGSRTERLGWVDYEDFKEDVDDIGDGGFKDETIGHWECFRQPRDRWDFRNKTRGEFGQRGNFRNFGGHDNVDAIK